LAALLGEAQLPLMHSQVVGFRTWPAGQASRQTPPQAGLSAGQAQAPLWQVMPPPQASPPLPKHPPQLPLSLLVSVQVPLQHVLPPVQTLPIGAQ
jgi:hypothetical protein